MGGSSIFMDRDSCVPLNGNLVHRTVVPRCQSVTLAVSSELHKRRKQGSGVVYLSSYGQDARTRLLTDTVNAQQQAC